MSPITDTEECVRAMNEERKDKGKLMRENCFLDFFFIYQLLLLGLPTMHD